MIFFYYFFTFLQTSASSLINSAAHVGSFNKKNRLLLVEIHFLQDKILRGFIILDRRKKNLQEQIFVNLKKSFFGNKNFVENPCFLSQCLEKNIANRNVQNILIENFGILANLRLHRICEILECFLCYFLF